MAVIKRGVLGGFSGKVANVVGSSWKGISVMRSLPLSVANPRTNAQIKVRNKFSRVAYFGSALLSTIVKPLWDRFAQEMSGYNAFVRANYRSWDGVSEFGDSDQFIMSQGKLGQTPIETAAIIGGGTGVNIAWNSVPQGSYQQDTDDAYVVVFDGNPNLVFSGKLSAKRMEGEAQIDIPVEYQGDTTYYVHLAFAREDGTIVGDTSYKVAQSA